MSIEAGALVLADQGVCGIDEFDKMTCDPSSLLEAMEQQHISIAKSGIATSLKCRSAILAAANPKAGKYRREKTVAENLKLSSALISRFDLIFILFDKHDKLVDLGIAEQVLSARGSSNQCNFNRARNGRANYSEEDISLGEKLRRVMEDAKGKEISHELFRKYIRYAKLYVNPKLTPSSAKVQYSYTFILTKQCNRTQILQKTYLKLRSENNLGFPITTRVLENFIRLCQARAKLELREQVWGNMIRLLII